jgi:hypothetical protein
LLERIWGRDHAQVAVLREYELYSAWQFLTRINSRRFASTDQREYVVADKEQA